MSFNVLKNQKRKRRRVRKKGPTRKRKCQEAIPNSKRVPKFKLMINTSDELPPETSDEVITYNPIYGFEISKAFVCRQHIIHDRQTLGYSRVTHWFLLKNL